MENKRRKNNAPGIVAAVTVSKEDSPSLKLEKIISGLKQVLEQAKWRGGTVNLDANFFLGMLMVMKEIALKVEELENSAVLTEGVLESDSKLEPSFVTTGELMETKEEGKENVS